MIDTIIAMQCPVCETVNTIQLTVLFKNKLKGTFGFLFLAKCNQCFRGKGDSGSIQGKQICTAREFNDALDVNVICLTYEG